MNFIKTAKEANLKTYIITVRIKSKTLDKAYKVLQKLLEEAKVTAFQLTYKGVE